jgi:hypothetical protein
LSIPPTYRSFILMKAAELFANPKSFDLTFLATVHADESMCSDPPQLSVLRVPFLL